jgi:hypothetical protein
MPCAIILIFQGFSERRQLVHGWLVIDLILLCCSLVRFCSATMASDKEQLLELIKEQGVVVRSLKEKGAEKSQVTAVAGVA